MAVVQFHFSPEGPENEYGVTRHDRYTDDCPDRAFIILLTNLIP